VGAWKQADVGLALLSGFGNTNTVDEDEAGAEKEKEKEAGAGAVVSRGGGGGGGGPAQAEDELNEQTKMLAKKMQQATKVRKSLMAAKQKELVAKQQVCVGSRGCTPARPARPAPVLAPVSTILDTAQH
jgi:cation-transporting ATPase 13A1